MKFNNKNGMIPMLLGIILVIGALLLTGYNLWSEYRGGKLSQEILEKFGPEHILFENEIPDYILDPNMDMPEIEIDGKRYIGKISVPDLDLTLPVMSEWSYPNLKIAPCRYKGNAYKNNLIIAAHNYRTHFGRIRNLPIDSSIIFTDVDGNKFYYYIDSIENVKGEDIESMEVGNWDLSLFTCNYRGDVRVTIRCKRTDQ